MSGKQEGILGTDAETVNGILDFGMTQSGSDRPQVACSFLNRGGFRAPQGVRTVVSSRSDRRYPFAHQLALHEYNECWLSWSCMETEPDPRIKKIWELHLAMEIERSSHRLRDDARSGRHRARGSLPGERV